MNELREFLHDVLGMTNETQNKVLVSFLVLALLAVVRAVLLKLVWKRVKAVKSRYLWKRTLSVISFVVGLILLGALWIPGIGEFGAFLGLMTAGLAIAFKDPLTNLAGWVFIVFRKPFVVGDRIQLGQYSGDVVDIRLFQFTLLEIGNWVDADQSTGRIVHLPNGKVFQEAQANYSTGFEFIWNEIPIVITFESDWKEAREILKEIINRHAENLSATAEKEIFEASKNFMIYYRHLTPIVYTRVVDYGVKLTIRYLCNPRKRRGSENDIWEDVLDQFGRNENIQLAYPTTRFYKAGETTS